MNTSRPTGAPALAKKLVTGLSVRPTARTRRVRRGATAAGYHHPHPFGGSNRIGT